MVFKGGLDALCAFGRQIATQDTLDGPARDLRRYGAGLRTGRFVVGGLRGGHDRRSGDASGETALDGTQGSAAFGGRAVMIRSAAAFPARSRCG